MHAVWKEMLQPGILFPQPGIMIPQPGIMFSGGVEIFLHGLELILVNVLVEVEVVVAQAM